MGVSLGLFDRIRKGLSGATALDASAAGGLVFGVLGNRGAPPPRNAEEFLKAYNEQPWLRAVTWKIATSIATVDWHVYAVSERGTGKRVRDRKAQRLKGAKRRAYLKQLAGRGQLEEITEHPFLDLMSDSNPWHTGVSIRRLTQLYLDLVGESFALLERNGAGVPVRAWPVPPYWVRETPSAGSPYFVVEVGAWSAKVPFSEMLWLCEPDVTNPYGRGGSVTQALGEKLQTAEHLARFTNSFFWNHARPDLIVVAEGKKPEELDDMRGWWDARTRGVWKAFRPLFLNYKPEIVQVPKDLSSLKVTELDDSVRDAVIQTYGVPPEILGIIENSNRATIEAAHHLFALTVLEPRLEFLRNYYQERLGETEYDKRIIIDYDSPVTADRDHIRTMMEKHPYVFRVDEIREMAEHEPLADDMGQVFVSALAISFKDEIKAAEPMPMLPAFGGGPPDPDEVDDEDEDEDVDVEVDEDADPQARAIRALVKADPPTDDSFYILMHRVADRLEPAVRRTFLTAVDALEDAIDERVLAQMVAALRAGNIDSVLRHIPFPAWRAVFENVVDSLREAVAVTGQAAATETSRVFGVTIDFAATDPRAVEWARRHAAELVVEIEDETRAAIRQLVVRSVEGEFDAPTLARQIKETGIGLTRQQERFVHNFRERLIDQGRPATEIERRVRQYARAWRRRRATVIARTETINAASQGQQLAWEAGLRQGQLQRGLVRKIPIVTPDDRLDTVVCEPMPFLEANQNVAIDGFLTTGDGRLARQPTYHPQCRCATALVPALPTALGLGAYRLARALGALCRSRPERAIHATEWPGDYDHLREVNVAYDPLWMENPSAPRAHIPDTITEALVEMVRSG